MKRLPEFNIETLVSMAPDEEITKELKNLDDWMNRERPELTMLLLKAAGSLGERLNSEEKVTGPRPSISAGAMVYVGMLFGMLIFQQYLKGKTVLREN